MKVTLYHNPACGTSCKVLILLREQGIEPEIVEYMKTPPSRPEFAELVNRSGLSVHEFLRKKERLYDALDLVNPKWTEDDLINFLAENPILLNRPVVVTAKGVRSCRPAEAVLELNLIWVFPDLP